MPLSTRVWRSWQVVWQGPRLGFVAETDALLLSTHLDLSTIFLRFCLASFASFSPSLSRYVLLRPCSSHPLSFTKYVFLQYTRNIYIFVPEGIYISLSFVFCHLCCLILRLFCFYLFYFISRNCYSYFIGCVISYPVRGYLICLP